MVKVSPGGTSIGKRLRPVRDNGGSEGNEKWIDWG